jgi:hypothetical protein
MVIVRYLAFIFICLLLSIGWIAQGQKENFLTYKNFYNGIRIQYPSDWIKSEENRIISFKSPDVGHASSVSLQTSDLSVSNMSLNMLIKKNIDTQRYYFTNFSLIESTLNNTESKEPYTIIFTYKNRYSPVEFKSMQVWNSNNKNNVYLITYTSPADDFDRYLPIVKYMINSFEIVKQPNTAVIK